MGRPHPTRPHPSTTSSSTTSSSTTSSSTTSSSTTLFSTTSSASNQTAVPTSHSSTTHKIGVGIGAGIACSVIILICVTGWLWAKRRQACQRNAGTRATQHPDSLADAASEHSLPPSYIDAEDIWELHRPRALLLPSEASALTVVTAGTVRKGPISEFALTTARRAVMYLRLQPVHGAMRLAGESAFTGCSRATPCAICLAGAPKPQNLRD